MVIKMKKKFIIIGIIAIIALAAAGLIYASSELNKKEKLEDSFLIELTFDELQKKIDNKDTFILVLTQTSCSHCIEYKPKLKNVLAEYNIYAYELPIDKLDKTEIAKLKDIANASGTPATIFIEEGEEKNTSSRLYGSQDKSKIVSRFKAMGFID